MLLTTIGFCRPAAGGALGDEYQSVRQVALKHAECSGRCMYFFCASEGDGVRYSIDYLLLIIDYLLRRGRICDIDSAKGGSPAAILGIERLVCDTWGIVSGV